MNKITWILIWSVTSLVARTTTAIRCYTCNSIEYKTCGDPFFPPAAAQSCSAEMRQCYKAKVKVRGASGEITVVLRGCAPPASGNNGCQRETKLIPLPDGTLGQAKGDWCLCATDLCNGGSSGQVRQETRKVTVPTSGKVTRSGGNPSNAKAKGNEGEQFQPKMKLLMMAMATAFMNILVN